MSHGGTSQTAIAKTSEKENLMWVLKHDQEFSKHKNENMSGQGTLRPSTWLLKKEVSKMDKTLGAILESLEFKLWSDGCALS